MRSDSRQYYMLVLNANHQPLKPFLTLMHFKKDGVFSNKIMHVGIKQPEKLLRYKETIHLSNYESLGE